MLGGAAAARRREEPTAGAVALPGLGLVLGTGEPPSVPPAPEWEFLYLAPCLHLLTLEVEGAE
jgi:hypothetical protein